MKKPFIAFSIVCACATGAFADHGANEQWQNPWFKAIGTSATKDNPNPTNGLWEDFAETGVTFTDGKMVLDQEGTDAVTFNMTEATAGDTNTIVEVKAKAKFYPVLLTDLTTPSNAKVAFAVVKDGGALSYRAWVTGQEEWTVLNGLGTPTTSDEVEVLIRMNYRNANTTSDTDARQVSFTVGGTTSTTLIALPDSLTTNPTGFSIAGCGTVASVDGEVQYNVASIGDIGYATIGEAAAHPPTGVDVTISVDRATDENVNVSGSGIKIADNGNMSGTITVAENDQVDVAPTAADITSQEAAGASGEYTFNVKVSGSTNVVIELPEGVAEYKEVKPGSVKVDSASGVTAILQTHSTIITDAVTAAECKLEVNDNLREFLLTADQTISNAYIAAQASSTTIGNALKADGNNELKKWQSYVLGITPTTSVAPVSTPAGDTDSSYIILAIPAIDTSKYSGDYEIKYAQDAEVSDDPSEIRVPLTTGEYEVKILLEEPVTPL